MGISLLVRCICLISILTIKIKLEIIFYLFCMLTFLEALDCLFKTIIDSNKLNIFVNLLISDTKSEQYLSTQNSLAISSV